MLSTESLLEALLFVADGAIGLEDLAKALDCDVPCVEQALERLSDACAERGLRVLRTGARIQMVSAPEAGPVVERFLGVSHAGRLSPAALETLAIIAYRQPITRAQIEAIRGTNSDAVIRTLIARSLVAPVGRAEQAGRPMLLGTTCEFQQYFGLQSLAELPPLPETQDITEPTPARSG